MPAQPADIKAHTDADRNNKFCDRLMLVIIAKTQRSAKATFIANGVYSRMYLPTLCSVLALLIAGTSCSTTLIKPSSAQSRLKAYAAYDLGSLPGYDTRVTFAMNAKSSTLFFRLNSRQAATNDGEKYGVNAWILCKEGKSLEPTSDPQWTGPFVVGHPKDRTAVLSFKAIKDVHGISAVVIRIGQQICTLEPRPHEIEQ